MIGYFQKHIQIVCEFGRIGTHKKTSIKMVTMRIRGGIIKELKAFTTHDMNIAALRWSYCLSNQVRQST